MSFLFEPQLRALPALPALPQEEMDLLCNAIDSAEVQAGFGNCEDAYFELSYGLRRAELMLRDGIPWAQVLEAQYRSALHEFCSRFRFTPA